MLSTDHQNYQMQKLKFINMTGTSSLLKKTYIHSQLSTN